MKYNPFNNDQGRIQPPPDLQHDRLDAPDDLPELHSQSIVGYVFIVILIAGVALAIFLVAGAGMIARSFAANDAKETRAKQICAEHFNMRGQWRYASDTELWCSSAETGAVRVVMI